MTRHSVHLHVAYLHNHPSVVASKSTKSVRKGLLITRQNSQDSLSTAPSIAVDENVATKKRQVTVDLRRVPGVDILGETMSDYLLCVA